MVNENRSADVPHFQVGLFSANASSGLAVTAHPDRWAAEWSGIESMAETADDGGIDFLLPIARWIGYGGLSNYSGSVLEPTVLAAALLARTSRVRVFTTVHTAFHHPVVAAKQLATLDRIAPGRVGLNIVAGWNKPEYDAFGIDLPQDHDARYDQAQEWFDVVHRLWTETQPFDHDGEHFRLKGVSSFPGPASAHLPVLNAGSSGQGRAFAARNADHAFTVVRGAEDGADVAASIRKDGAALGREVGAFTLGHVVCRPTRAEAEDFLSDYAGERADWEAVDTLMRLQGLHAKSFTPEMLATARTRFAAGHGSCPLIGTPDDVADGIAAFHTAGFTGIALAFVDYAGELPYFVQEVLPRLEARGIRAPR